MSMTSDRGPYILLLLGFTLLLIGGEASADPVVADSCSTKCQHKDLFIQSPKLNCVLFGDPICDFCNDGVPNSRCIDYVGPGLPSCTKTGTTKLSDFPMGSCRPKCTLPLNGTSESSFGLPPLKERGDWDKTSCAVGVIGQ